MLPVKNSIDYKGGLIKYGGFMKAYSFFAKVYDVFMNDIPYVDWLDGIEAYMERRNIQCHRVLELGCGTGRFTALLAADGYEVTGLDLSEAMIKVAKKKPFGKRISYVCSDMRNFNLGKKFDVVISVCDSMNYLLNNDDMYNTFLSVGKHLEKGGFFIFDLKTETFYEKLGNNIYSDERISDDIIGKTNLIKRREITFIILVFLLKAWENISSTRKNIHSMFLPAPI